MAFWVAFGIFLLIVGFAKLSTMIVNRLLAIPQPKWIIGLTEVIQFILITIYAAIVSLSGISHINRLSVDPLTSNGASIGIQVLIVLGLLGLLFLIRSTIAFQAYRVPACQIDVTTETLDFRVTSNDEGWKQTLVGPGPMRRIALFPFNEQFTLNVSSRTLVLPRLPQNWDGLSIVQFADTHFRGAVTPAYFQAVCQQAMELKPDLLVFTGDLLDDSRLVHWLPETLGRLDAPLGRYFVLGNHDWYQNESEIRQEFERLGWIDLASRSIQLTSRTPGPSISIAGDETPWMGSHPQFKADDEFRILLSHTPDNIAWARQNHVDLMLAGHTHGGQIQLPLLGPVYSPSRYGCRFASGVFWLQPTLLYVSRGLSGREPIRFHCPPELTKLTLKCQTSV